MRITELFFSIQGEGRLAGLPTTFVRTTGCHLRCSWCDASYTFSGGETKSLEEILNYVRAQPTKHVCFTGGEPLLQKDAWEFVRTLAKEGFHTLIETSGSIPFTEANNIPQRDLVCVSMDVKCPSSGEHEKNRDELAKDLRAPDQLKFVIADRIDFDFAVAWLEANGYPPCPVFFNPVGGTDIRNLTNWLLESKNPPRVQVGVQLHKMVWGDVPGH